MSFRLLEKNQANDIFQIVAIEDSKMSVIVSLKLGVLIVIFGPKPVTSLEFQAENLGTRQTYFSASGHVISAIINGIPSPSHSRPYFVRISRTGDFRSGFCGGAIVDPSFVLTAGHCLYGLDESEITVEVGDFTIANSIKTRYAVSHVYYPDQFSKSIRPFVDDVALISLRGRVEELQRVLPPCGPEVGGELIFDGILGASGMGTVSIINSGQFPERLLDMFFQESSYIDIKPFDRRRCRDDLICAVPITEGGSVCAYDDGGPLFKSYCGTSTPECLYGVVNTFHINERYEMDVSCTALSYFSKVSKHTRWIQHTISTHQSHHDSQRSPDQRSRSPERSNDQRSRSPERSNDQRSPSSERTPVSRSRSPVPRSRSVVSRSRSRSPVPRPHNSI
ncbi:myeloblastin-like [Convolutriloba macropyga]|uniref:myeloblastin-like n=1 Tax=Convolutriloba macropyga TaxID=536237 RepID=UPI003F51CF2E